MYQLNISAIQALLAQDKSALGGITRGVTQEDKKDDGGFEFKVTEGEKQRMRKMCGIEKISGDECFTKMV